MSFSSEVKQELNKNSNLVNKEIVKNELIGYLISRNIEIVEKKNIKFSTESDYNINRFSKLLTNLNINHHIEIIGRNFVIKLKKKDIQTLVEIKDNLIYLKENYLNGIKEEFLRAIVRGVFMGSGSINDPNKKYHLEISFNIEENLNGVISILKILGINTKKMIIENKKSLYIKEGEEISKFLALIGAAKAVMKFEEIRIRKEMRGKVNRIVNCETANLNKTINASIEQIAAIKKLKENGKFNNLSENLKEIANLRLENPDMALSDLGKKLDKPLGKSGVNYRLRKIMEIANE